MKYPPRPLSRFAATPSAISTLNPALSTFKFSNVQTCNRFLLQPSIFKAFPSIKLRVAFSAIPLFSAPSALPPVISKSHLSKENHMTQQDAKPRFINNFARWTYLFPNGRRCRLHATNVNPNFCPAHAPLPANQHDASEIASTLTVNLDDFTSAAQINDFLARLLLLLAQDKISTRRAAVLAYITNQLLRTPSPPPTQNPPPAEPPSSPTSPTNSSAPSPPSPKRKTPSLPPLFSTCQAPTATRPTPTILPAPTFPAHPVRSTSRPHPASRTRRLRRLEQSATGMRTLISRTATMSARGYLCEIFGKMSAMDCGCYPRVPASPQLPY